MVSLVQELKVALFLICTISSFFIGEKVEGAKFELYKREQSDKALEVSREQTDVSNQIEIKYIEGSRKIETVTKEILKYVPKYIKTPVPIPDGFVWLHNSAASATQLPSPSGGIDDPSSGVTLDTVATTLIDNYEICNRQALQLKSFQVWIGKMEDVN